jgi:hypothetical protein
MQSENKEVEDLADKETKQYFKKLLRKYGVIKFEVETIESDQNQIVSDYLEGKISVKEMIKQKNSFEDELYELKQELNII